MWASTLCPLSSSTRNVALGSGSTTAPSTSIASFFATLQLLFRHPNTLARLNRAGTSRNGPTQRPQPQYTGSARLASSASTAGREDLGAVRGQGDGVLEVGGEGAVRRHDRPAVGQRPRGPVAHVHHGLDGHHHAPFERQALPRLAVVGDLGVLVQRPSDAMADVLPDHAEPGPFDDLLDGAADVAESGALPDLADRGLERLLRHPDELLD